MRPEDLVDAISKVDEKYTDAAAGAYYGPANPAGREWRRSLLIAAVIILGLCAAMAGSLFLASRLGIIPDDGEESGTNNNETVATVTDAPSTKAPDGMKISTAAEFLAMKADGTYWLDADITLTASYEATFTGTFDGNGHTVTVSGVPMFADIGKSVIKNLTIDGSIESDRSVGALATTCSARIFDDFSDYAVIENCVNKANVTMTVPDIAEKDSWWGVGGFIGKSAEDCGAMFIGCVNEGAVTVKCRKEESCRFYAGGFAGICDTFLARNSENRGDVKFDGDYEYCLGQDGCGGFVGRVAMTAAFNFCNIEYCVNNGNVRGGRYAGGFLAYAGLANNCCQYLLDNTPYRFFANINNGDIEGKLYAGGIAGFCYGSGSTDIQTVDIEFNLIGGRITSDQWCSPFVAYSNSAKNIIMYNISTAGLAKRTEDAADHMFVLLGCSSVDYRISTTFRNNYIVDDAGAVRYLTYATTDAFEKNCIEIAWGIDNNYVSVVSASQLATGEIAYRINEAAGTNGFNQTIGKDPAPTPSRGSSFVSFADGRYINTESPAFPVLGYYDLEKKVQ
ncbi:MAG: hypothetical protein J6V48_11425 [Clostridia bacterium]|nr:hypothetical protein [Clostridia bacterium]